MGIMLKRVSSLISVLGKKVKDGWPKELEEGRFTTYCKQQGFSGPCKACAEKAMESDDPSVRGMASFYTNTVLKQKKDE
jgi:hypothetical protein